MQMHGSDFSLGIANDICHFLFPQKESNQRNSLLRLLLLKLVLLLLLCYPNQTMPVFTVNGGIAF